MLCKPIDVTCGPCWEILLCAGDWTPKTLAHLPLLELELFPWEMLTVLQDHPVCRMPNLHMLYALYKGGAIYADSEFLRCNFSGHCTKCIKHMKEHM